MGTTKLGVIRSNHGTLGVAVEVVQLLVDLLLLAVLPQQTSPQAVEYWVNTEASTGSSSTHQSTPLFRSLEKA